ncbi:MAG: hypothetical protein JWO70_1087, partial [Betaproteobacteria bacterium]|nr:hypothetical protein [Betaproteobacteria bacterium]
MNAGKSLWSFMPVLASCAIAGVFGADAHAQATSTSTGQAWPTRPIRMILAVAPGGGTDIQARLFSQKLQ